MLLSFFIVSFFFLFLFFFSYFVFSLRVEFSAVFVYRDVLSFFSSSFFFSYFFPFLRVGSSCLLGRGHSLISPVICHRLGTYLLQSRYTFPPCTAVRAVLVDRSGTGWLSVALRPQKP